MLRRITTCIVTTCHSSIFGTTYQPIEFEGEGLGRRVVWRGRTTSRSRAHGRLPWSIGSACAECSGQE
ncbi:hypothetical protein SEA_MORI_21 [Mycobacterium phage Mori]|nr:hypothetical protein SEA_MORI_21 [Mycobacterium phage Mori]